MRAQPQAPAPERVLVSHAQLAAARGPGRVAQQFGEGKAPRAAELPAHAGVDAVLARRHPGEALGDVVGRMAFEAVAEEYFQAPFLRGAELQPDARRAEVEALALVDVQGREVVPRARVAIGRALDAPHNADRGAVGRGEARQRIAVGRGRSGEEDAQRQDEKSTSESVSRRRLHLKCE
jgi:hypothetical protein